MKLRVLLSDVLDAESLITFPAFLILSDTSRPSPRDSLQAVTEYVSRAGLTWQGCLDWPGEVIENTAEMMRTHGSFLYVYDRKGHFGPMRRAVSEGMAMRSSCLPDEPPAGPGEDTQLQKAGAVSEKSCLHDIGFCCSLFVFVNLSEVSRSFSPGICLRNFVLGGLNG